MPCSYSITVAATEMKLNISNNIRKLRFDNGEMTQQALADAVGVTRQTVIAIEKAKYSPSLEVAFRMAEVFSVKLDDIFEYQKRG